MADANELKVCGLLTAPVPSSHARDSRAVAIGRVPVSSLLGVVHTQQAKGNAAFASGHYADAVKCFTDAIALDPTNHVLWSNRSAAQAGLQDYGAALADAEKVLLPPLATASPALVTHSSPAASPDGGAEAGLGEGLLPPGRSAVRSGQAGGGT